jgi:hypothetical protein
LTTFVERSGITKEHIVGLCATLEYKMQVSERMWYGRQVKHTQKCRASKAAVLIFAFNFMLSAAALGAPLPIADIDDVYPIVPNWKRARILHIGDSQLSGSYKASMARFFSKAGAVFRQETWVGSRSKSWVVSGKAAGLAKSFRPSVAVITLGTNIIKSKHPKRHLSWIRALIRRVGAKQCYWIGPPPLIPDLYGYNDLMAENTAPCRYFDSRALDFPRRKNGRFHLSGKQGAIWAERVWRFMNGR